MRFNSEGAREIYLRRRQGTVLTPFAAQLGLPSNSFTGLRCRSGYRKSFSASLKHSSGRSETVGFAEGLSRPPQKSAIIFVAARLIVPWTRRMEYRAAGRESAYVSSGGEQRVTRGSILYRGRGPPLVTAVFSLMHDRCHSLRMAVAATPKRRHTVGPYPCASPSAPSYPRLVACLRE